VVHVLTPPLPPVKMLRPHLDLFWYKSYTQSLFRNTIPVRAINQALLIYKTTKPKETMRTLQPNEVKAVFALRCKSGQATLRKWQGKCLTKNSRIYKNAHVNYFSVYIKGACT
jgi:hypothetical protein